MKGDKLNPPEPRIPTCAGGSKSEGQWRREFAAGLSKVLHLCSAQTAVPSQHDLSSMIFPLGGDP